MQIIPSAVYRVGDRPNMTSRDWARNSGLCSQPATDLAWLALPACTPACVRQRQRDQSPSKPGTGSQHSSHGERQK